MILDFPSVELADEDGVLCIGGDLEVESLLLAYRRGIFPWPVSKQFPLVWFAPPTRALLFLEELHIPRSLRRARNSGKFTFTIDAQFEQVIRACSESRTRKRGSATWITPAMIEGYIDFHRAGWAHSVECYTEDRLAGGLYGVAIGGMFAGESMFYTVDDASKLALWHLADHLRERGVEWIDCQQLTPFFQSLGAREVGRNEFQRLLADAAARPVSLFD